MTVNKWLCLNSWITVTLILFQLPQSGTRLLDYFMVSLPVLAEGVTLATENLNSACTPDKPVFMYTIILSPQQQPPRSLGHYMVKYHSYFRPFIHSQKIWKSERSQWKGSKIHWASVTDNVVSSCTLWETCRTRRGTFNQVSLVGNVEIDIKSRKYHDKIYNCSFWEMFFQGSQLCWNKGARLSYW